MEKASFIALIQNGMSHAGDHAMNGATLFFAYLTMSYFVGMQLSRFQAWAVSVLYTGFLMLPSYVRIPAQDEHPFLLNVNTYSR